MHPRLVRLLRPLYVVFFAVAAAFTGAARAQERVLTEAIEVRALSRIEAESGLPVRLRGIVVFVESASAIFLQDTTSTTFFRIRPKGDVPSVGDEIELTGTTRMGLYLPGLDFSTYRVLGRQSLPPGIPARYDDLVFSRYHYQRVTLEGIVRSVTPTDQKKSVIRLAMGSRVIEARVEKPPQEERALVDHRVRITGLAVGLINKNRQLVQPYVRVLDWDEVEVLAPAPPAAEVPAISAEDLLAFRVTGHGEQRVRIEGTVTAAFPGDHVYLQQGTRAFGVRFGLDTPLSPGDRVTLAGFPEMERFSASVVDAELVSREPGPALPPEIIASPEKLNETHDCQLVRLTGTVRDVFKIDDGIALLLAGKVRTLQVRLPATSDGPEIGARVQVTGIAQLQLVGSPSGFGTNSNVGLATVRVRNLDDLIVLQSPGWWTVRRLVIGLAALAGVTLLAGLWIGVLRRQVRRQTAALRHRIEAEAALEERQRIAREFHDTLEQELAGVSLRLDALATRELDDKGRHLITASRNLVSRIQTETRDLISDLRDPTETAGDLATALAAVAARHSADSGADVRFHTSANLPMLPAATVHDLRMIARESVTNAINHGRASHVVISVELPAKDLVITIADNGCGFDATSATQEKRGHFGCAGMRERGRKIGATVNWRSVLQMGTTVEVRLPLSATNAIAPASLTNPTDFARTSPDATPRTSPASP